MEIQPLLTIVIPAYNEGKVLPHVLLPILALCELYNFLVIVVNDGSKDDTKAVLSEISHKRLTVLTNKVNKGYGGLTPFPLENRLIFK